MSRATYEKVNNSGHGAGLEVAESLGHISERLGFTACSKNPEVAVLETVLVAAVGVAAVQKRTCPLLADMLSGLLFGAYENKNSISGKSPELSGLEVPWSADL